MRNESKKPIEQSASETADERPQSDASIEDLSPNPDKANDVRGGALPPSDVKVYAIPPQD